MKRLVARALAVVAGVTAVGALLLTPATLVAQSKAKAENVPEIPITSVPDFFKLPPDLYFGEGIGIATNSKGHIFVYTRSGDTRVLEFDQNGNYVKEIGQGLYGLEFAHTIRVDKDDNIWVVDKGSNMILKMNPQGRVEWVFGRKGESSHLDVPPDYASQLANILKRAGVAVTIPENNNPRNPVPVHRDNAFNQPTDVAWDSKGNSYFSDGYVNSRVGKANAKGEWVASWGSLGLLTRPQPWWMSWVAALGTVAVLLPACGAYRWYKQTKKHAWTRYL